MLLWTANSDYNVYKNVISWGHLAQRKSARFVKICLDGLGFHSAVCCLPVIFLCDKIHLQKWTTSILG